MDIQPSQSLNVMLKSAKQSQNDFLQEWITRRDTFLQLLLELEGRSDDGLCSQCRTSDGLFHCSDCIGDLVHCHNCFMERHRLLPFHRIQMWNDAYFARTTLHDQGYILHLGHHGEMCSDAEDPWFDVEGNIAGMDNVDLLQDGMGGGTKDVLVDGVVNIVHTTGVFKHKVQWCQCQSAPDKAVQLFPASHL